MSTPPYLKSLTGSRKKTAQSVQNQTDCNLQQDLNAIIQVASRDVKQSAVEEEQADVVQNTMLDASLGEDVPEEQFLGDIVDKQENLRNAHDNEVVLQNLKKVSEGVVVGNTLAEYRRWWKLFTQFCVAKGYIGSVDEIELQFPDIPSELPMWISIWIMDKCDEIDMYTGEARPPDVIRATFATAQKMCAAVSHKFARGLGVGTQPWTESILKPSKYSGNPSLSVIVSQYMISLKRRKVRKGEQVISAKAMDESTMKRIWEYNISFESASADTLVAFTKKHREENPEEWTGYVVRMNLQLLYVTAMLCLLRFDEALRIQWTDVNFEKWGEPGMLRIKLELPFRKTHQNGGIAPFFLYPNPEKLWMCPVRAWSVWVKLHLNSGDKLEGFVFQKKIGTNSYTRSIDKPMSSESFMECFRNNLLDIEVDPRPYGTHSFRCGGCQYLAMVLRWPFCNICTWGGWADNFDNPGTLFKYLLSWTNAPFVNREDYFNPERPNSNLCTKCSRTCPCA